MSASGNEQPSQPKVYRVLDSHCFIALYIRVATLPNALVPPIFNSDLSTSIDRFVKVSQIPVTLHA